MNGLIIIGFVCLALLVLFYLFFLKRVWFYYAAKLIGILLAVFAFYAGALIIKKYVKEDWTTYSSLEEVMQKNYNDSDVDVVSDENYYYLIINDNANSSETKEELIRFENNKYLVFDLISRFTKGTKRHEYSVDYIGRRIEYETKDNLIVIIKSVTQDIKIYDEYGLWNSINTKDYSYHINVISKAKIADGYRVFLSIGSYKY